MTFAVSHRRAGPLAISPFVFNLYIYLLGTSYVTAYTKQKV